MLLYFAHYSVWSHVDSRWPSGETCGQLVDFLLAMDDTELLETARNLCQKRRLVSLLHDDILCTCRSDINIESLSPSLSLSLPPSLPPSLFLPLTLSFSLSPPCTPPFVAIGWVWFSSPLPWVTRGQHCVPCFSSETNDCLAQNKDGVSENFCVSIAYACHIKGQN